MRGLLICLILVTLTNSVGNTGKMTPALNPGQKLFIITLDGFRWEELFRGADAGLLNNRECTPNPELTTALYWDDDAQKRREKLMPFFWNVIARQGALYGNRDHGNKVNVANPYSLSYPGYNELLTGKIDYSIYANYKKMNPNKNMLEVLNKSEEYRGKVAAFASWELFPYILNKKDGKGFTLNSGLQKLDGKQLTPSQVLVNAIQGGMDEEETRYDELTFVACKEYLMKHKPSVVFLGFSGTDNAGHDNRYDQYLQEANNADRMIGELWRLVQSMPEYAGNTTFLITTDHGRGKKSSDWSEHGILISGSSQTWYGMIGNGTMPYGEVKVSSQVYLKELNAVALEVLSRKR